MKTPKHALALSALIFAASAAFALAAANDWDYEDEKSFSSPKHSQHYTYKNPSRDTQQQQTNRAHAPGTKGQTPYAYETSFSAEVFYGSDESDNEFDLWGVAFRYTTKSKKTLVRNTLITPEAFIAGRLGAGEESERYDGYKTTATGVLWTLSAGGAIRAQVTPGLSVFVRGEIGAALEYIKLELKDGSWKYENNDTDIGLLFGVGVGAQFDINKSGGIVVALDWFTTTCEAFENYGADKPEYITLSVGYKWSF